jgi:hypothetical protein
VSSKDRADLDDLARELLRVGIAGGLRRRILDEFSDHLECEPRASLGEPAQLARTVRRRARNRPCPSLGVCDLRGAGGCGGAVRAHAIGGAAVGASALLANPLIERALASPPACGSLSDIQHVVIRIQENRSFDHCFGSYRGVTGFADPAALPLGDGSGLSIFAQPGYPGGFAGNHLYPFHLDSFHNGECTNDINHSWGPQHGYWDGGKLDGFASGHIAADGAANGPLTMGYYTRADLSFYYALADAFTICDHYYCSVIGPTDPNRLYSLSGTLDPGGSQGGPILSTSATRVERFGTLSWTTMPEQLQLEGLRQPRWQFRRQRAAVLQAVRDQSGADRQRAHPDVPRHVSGGRRARDAAAGLLDPPTFRLRRLRRGRSANSSP